MKYGAGDFSRYRDAISGERIDRLHSRCRRYEAGLSEGQIMRSELHRFSMAFAIPAMCSFRTGLSAGAPAGPLFPKPFSYDTSRPIYQLRGACPKRLVERRCCRRRIHRDDRYARAEHFGFHATAFVREYSGRKLDVGRRLARSRDLESSNIDRELFVCLDAFPGRVTDCDRPAFSNDWIILVWSSLGTLSVHSASANVGSSLGLGRTRNFRVSNMISAVGSPRSVGPAVRWRCRGIPSEPLDRKRGARSFFRRR